MDARVKPDGLIAASIIDAGAGRRSSSFADAGANIRRSCHCYSVLRRCCSPIRNKSVAGSMPARRGAAMQLRSTSTASRWCCVSFYGGYFGARRGHPDARRILAGDRRDYRSANVAKNFFSSLNGFAATLVFATQGAVLWPQTLALAAGTIAGGLIGAYIARVIPRNVVRVLVVVVGAALTIAFAWRYWF
jgi:uncharacterized membrane protein YfcA